ncbi:S8 family serine peptidase [Tamlana flava]|uniref:S8 family serine peptidase n=1 Tax=Tamlana flava TaxID=3158572 RepID=UPI00351BEADA
MTKGIVFCSFLLFQILSFAQEDAWVYFVDKENVSNSLANPITILTQKSIDRKSRSGVAIDERDVPVNENYISQLKSTTGITVMAKSKWLNAVHVRASQADISGLLELSFVSSVDFANKSLNRSSAKVDSLRQKLKYKLETPLTFFEYGSALNQVQMLKVDGLHVLGYTGAGMTIAVLDAGFPNVNTMNGFQRLRYGESILGAHDFVNRDDDVYTNTTSGHGTYVLSCMAGYLEGGSQYVGTAPDASYYLFITEDATSENPVEESYWVEAAERADSLGVDIINTSLGYTSYDNSNYSYAAADLNGHTAYISKGANIAFEKGMLVVASAGNSGNGGVGAPADSPNVLSVGAVDRNGNYASFSSVGSNNQPTQKPDVVAQGQASFIIAENDGIYSGNGTSFSAPILAGGLACLWQAMPDRNNAEIMQLIRESSSQYNSPDYFIGYGIPNFKAVVDGELPNGTYIPENLIVEYYPNPVEDKLYLKLTSNQNMVTFQLFDALGKFLKEIYVAKNELQTIDLDFLPQGMYMARITSSRNTKAFKLIKY